MMPWFAKAPAAAILFAMLVGFVVNCGGSSMETPPSSPHGADDRIFRIAGGAGQLRVSDGGAGAGSPVVFVHGLAASLDVWRAQLAFVRSSGRRAVAYDQRGHGESERAKDGVYSVDALARDLELVRQHLGSARIALVGHSFSGDVVTAYAAAHPEHVAGIVYADADGDFGVLSREAREKEVAAAASNSPAQWKAEWEHALGPHARPATRQLVLGALERVDPRALAALRADNVFFPSRERAARYAGPRWAIETDAPGAEFRAAALDPSIRLVTMRGVSHWLMLDDPAAFDAALGQALATMP